MHLMQFLIQMKLTTIINLVTSAIKVCCIQVTGAFPTTVLQQTKRNMCVFVEYIDL